MRVDADQPLGLLAALLLEPASPDSFFQWGFFLEMLQRTEYAEAYVMAPTAERMLAADPELAAEFERALEADRELAGDPAARLAVVLPPHALVRRALESLPGGARAGRPE